MLGSIQFPGLVPRFCRRLFDSIRADGNDATIYRVELSILEVTGDKVRDLLRPSHHSVLFIVMSRLIINLQSALRIREHADNGPYVENLTLYN